MEPMGLLVQQAHSLEQEALQAVDILMRQELLVVMVGLHLLTLTVDMEQRLNLAAVDLEEAQTSEMVLPQFHMDLVVAVASVVAAVATALAV
jgi:hypothetical protein